MRSTPDVFFVGPTDMDELSFGKVSPSHRLPTGQRFPFPLNVSLERFNLAWDLSLPRGSPHFRLLGCQDYQGIQNTSCLSSCFNYTLVDLHSCFMGLGLTLCFPLQGLFSLTRCITYASLPRRRRWRPPKHLLGGGTSICVIDHGGEAALGSHLEKCFMSRTPRCCGQAKIKVLWALASKWSLLVKTKNVLDQDFEAEWDTAQVVSILVEEVASRGKWCSSPMLRKIILSSLLPKVN